MENQMAQFGGMYGNPMANMMNPYFQQ